MKCRLLHKMSSLCNHDKQHLCENLIVANEHTELDRKASHAHLPRKVISKIHKMYIAKYGY